MSSSISLVTYAGQTVTPQDDALVYESALGDGGIIYGGEVTLKNANTLHINAGHGVIAGRKFTIFASDIAIPLSASGTLLGRLYIHMDLGNTADPIDILYETGNSLTPPVQDADVNIINGVFEFNLATFTVSTSTIADLSNIYPQIQYANSGSFIYVDTISPELIGAQVEVTDGVDTITAIFDANGRAELKNVFMTGTLQITASSGIYSAGTTLSVPYFGTYNVSLALWMATLNISTSNSVLFGQQITITDSSSAVVGTTTFSNVGTATFIVGAPDTYTLSVTYGGNTYTSTVNVTSETTYNVSINTLPDGATVLPTDDVQTWLSCAAISGLSYTTIAEVIADSETYNALLGDSNASAYMARSTTWTTDICADQYAMNLLGQYDTACDALLSDSTWASAIANSAYADYVLNGRGLVPVMTSNTTPSGVASASSYNSSGYEAYKAFDGNDSTLWVPAAGSINNYVAYEFTSPVKAKLAYVLISKWQTQSDDRTFYIRGTNNTSSWTNLGSFVVPRGASSGALAFAVELNNDTDYTYYSLYCAETMHVASAWSIQINTLQFYDLTPSGELIHGGNPTYDSFYRIVDGNNVPVTDPSLLDAGTYTIYSNGLAKAPDNLSNDYGKTVRICPNTKEIVVRPDNSLYWWGYESSELEDITTANGWSASENTLDSVTHNNKNITYTASSYHSGGVGGKSTVPSGKVIKCVSKDTVPNNDFGGVVGGVTSKVIDTVWANYTQCVGASNVLATNTLASTAYPVYFTANGRGYELSALWYE